MPLYLYISIPLYLYTSIPLYLYVDGNMILTYRCKDGPRRRKNNQQKSRSRSKRMLYVCAALTVHQSKVIASCFAMAAMLPYINCAMG